MNHYFMTKPSASSPRIELILQ